MMSERRRQIIDDLHYVFDSMPYASLVHLQTNAHRLIRRQFDDGAGGKCIFALLTECLPVERRIVCRKSLTRFYGGDPEAPHYQPARALVRLWDGHLNDEIVLARYGAGPRLPKSLLLRVLREVIRRRQAQAAIRNVWRSWFARFGAMRRDGFDVAPVTLQSVHGARQHSGWRLLSSARFESASPESPS